VDGARRVVGGFDSRPPPLCTPKGTADPRVGSG
jgi:hypothetical protein